MPPTYYCCLATPVQVSFYFTLFRRVTRFNLLKIHKLTGVKGFFSVFKDWDEIVKKLKEVLAAIGAAIWKANKEVSVWMQKRKSC